MKRKISAILAALLVFSLFAACSNTNSVETGSTNTTQSKTSSETQTDSAPSAEPEVVKLRIAHNMDFITIPEAIIGAAKRLEERYAAEGHNITIEFDTDYQRIDWSEYHNNLVFSGKSGDSPDIYTATGDVQGLVEAGMMLDITDVMSDKFVDDIFTPFMIDGKAYAMPVDMPLNVMYYNKESLAKIGWSDEQIKDLPKQIESGNFTFEKFLELAAEVQEKGASKWGLVHRPGAGVEYFDILKVMGGEVSDGNGTMLFDETALLHFFKLFYDNANVTKITPPDLNQMGWETINKIVASGDAFAYYGALHSYSYVANAGDLSEEELLGKISFTLFPTSQYNDKSFTSVNPQSIAISPHTKYPEICKDLFKELADGSNDLLANHATAISTLSSVKEANLNPVLLQNPLLKEVTYMSAYGSTTPEVKGITPYLMEMHKQLIQLELGQITPEQAVKDMKTQIELGSESYEVIFK